MSATPPEEGKRRFILLGSTGSIGTSTLDVLGHLEAEGRCELALAGLASGTNAERLRAQAAHWGVEDPAAFEGTEAETLDFFAAIHDELAAKIEAFVELDFETIPREELVEHVRAIADV